MSTKNFDERLNVYFNLLVGNKDAGNYREQKGIDTNSVSGQGQEIS